MIDYDLYQKMGLREFKVVITCNEVTISEVTFIDLGLDGHLIFSPYPVRVDSSETAVYSKKIEGEVRLYIEGDAPLIDHAIVESFGYKVIKGEHDIKELIKNEL